MRMFYVKNYVMRGFDNVGKVVDKLKRVKL